MAGCRPDRAFRLSVTFPRPLCAGRAPGHEDAASAAYQAIAAAAKELNDHRERWLNPPEWVTEEVLEFPGSTTGPWRNHIAAADKNGIGTVRYPRLVPKDADAAAKLAKRTLTNLYNENPAWLREANARLNAAVAAAYHETTGDTAWQTGVPDDGLLALLLALQQQRATQAS